VLNARLRDDLFAPFAPARGLLLAVSGGPDSLALLKLASDWRSARAAGPALFAATVDHGLREASRAEAQAVAEVCARLGVPHALLEWRGEKPRARLQERAREARYALLAEHARGCGADVLMVAHHRDDQAETLLMRMARGSGLAGLAGMRRASPLAGLVLARPLLDLPKEDLVAFCAAQGLAPAQDASNFDPRFARARLRRLSPLLSAEGLTAQRLADLARRAARVEDALARAVAQAAERLAPQATAHGVEISFAALLAEPEEIGLRLLEAQIAALAGAPVRLARLEGAFARLSQACRAGAPLRTSLAGAVLTLDRSGRLGVRPEGPRRRGRPQDGAQDGAQAGERGGEKAPSVHAIAEKPALDAFCLAASLGKGAGRA
jgi:tRNA(Ile)-lysidine synthase